jgi:hypothetical protein
VSDSTSDGELRESESEATQIMGVKMWPTPKARDARPGNQAEALRHTPDLPFAAGGHGGQLNPMWVGWLMGFPIGWSSCTPLETGSYRRWLAAHSSHYTGG